MRLAVCAQEAIQVIAIAPKQIRQVLGQASVFLDRRALGSGGEADNPVLSVLRIVRNVAGYQYLMILQPHAGIVHHNERIGAAMDVVQEAIERLAPQRRYHQRYVDRHWLEVGVATLAGQPALDAVPVNVAAALLGVAPVNDRFQRGGKA